MRRRLILGVTVSALVAGGWVVARNARNPGRDATARPTAASSPRSSPSPQGPTPVGPSGAPPPAPGSASPLDARASVGGRVLGPDDAPALWARVVAAGPVEREARSAADGSFAIDDLVPGEYTLSASDREFAAESLGPLPLARGEQVRGLVFRLVRSAILSGTVRDARTREGIPGAYVAGGAARATADTSGRFRLTGLAGGVRSIVAAADGFVTRAEEIALPYGTERSGVDIHLTPAARIAGVVRGHGGPVPGATVSAVPYAMTGRTGATAATARSDTAGRFTIDVPPGELSLVAQATGFAPLRHGPLAVDAGAPTEVELVLYRGGAALGAVRRPSATGDLACTVTFHDPSDGRVVGSAPTGPSGRYEVAHLSSDPLVGRAACGAAGMAERAGVEVPPGDAVEVDFELGAAALAGRVLDAFGRPVSGAAVGAGPQASAVRPVAVTTTRADGAFELSGVAGDRLRVVAESDRGTGEAIGVRAGDRSVEIRVGSGELVGHVAAQGGGSLTDFAAAALPVDGTSGRTRSQRFVAPTGDFRLSLSPGRYRVRVRAPGFPAQTQGPVEVEPGKTTPRLRFELLRPGVVAGRVTAESDGPIPGARVGTSFAALFAFGRAAPVAADVSATTDGEGRFRLAGLPAGERLRLFAYRAGYALGTVPDLEVPGSGAGAEVTIVLKPTDRAPFEEAYGGVGMIIGRRGEQYAIDEVLEGGPAWEGGARSGDQIVAVDGVAVAGLRPDEVVMRIRGAVGTPVTLGLRRGGQPVVVAVARASIRF